ncbi:MAG: hypothetical protein K0R65_556 [Crocinitomicaceae bacterium]|jgi:hypothetical protein|nr:hypothetical protein [Crocinitomicaceae bacterium]
MFVQLKIKFNFVFQSTLIMSSSKEQLEALQDIRKMMQESSKFLSLSGFSGVFAGIYALLGAWVGKLIFGQFMNQEQLLGSITPSYKNMLVTVTLLCLLVLVLSIVTAFIFSKQKAHKNGAKLFDKTTNKLLFNMAVPLLAGGIFCSAMIYHGETFIYLVSPAMLLFYGIALINGSKYTYHEIKALGLLEIVLGILALFFLGHGLLFWAIGFGALHIIYGILVWYKHDRQA